MFRFRTISPFALALALSTVSGCAAEEFAPESPGTGGAASSPSSGGAQSTGGAAGGPSSGGSAGGPSSSGGAASGGAPSGGGGPSTGKGPAGVSCTANGDCASGFCTDGVCCQSECGGPCETCNQPGKAGSCEPHPDGVDPEQDCLGAQKSDGPCAGRCDGNRACKMPGADTSCGATSCTNGKQTGSACDGAGVCAVAQKACAPFICSGSQCATACTLDLECADPGSYCKAPACVPKLDLGAACTKSTQCKSGSCVDGSCCASPSCGAGFSCSTGACLCNGMLCSPSDQCVPWYEDADGDGFGDKTKSALGCSSFAPTVAGKKYVANADDCYDANKNAFPGQTQFFNVSRGDNSFDYDCNGQDEKKYVAVSGPLCRDCHGYTAASCSLTCGTLGLQSAGLTCNLPNDCGGPKDVTAFAVDVSCGGMGDLKTCSGCTLGTPKSLGNAQQSCR